jgi:Ca2+-binding EF-hand superfamily protein
MKKIVILIAATFATAGTVALAAPDTTRGPGKGAMLERLKAADTNADGLLSRTEAAALPRLAERFDAIDANKDGQVSFEELRASRKGHGHRHGGGMKHADTDGDGKVSKAEMLARAEARFDRADANKDGFITADEMRRGPRHAGKR